MLPTLQLFVVVPALRLLPPQLRDLGGRIREGLRCNKAGPNLHIEGGLAPHVPDLVVLPPAKAHVLEEVVFVDLQRDEFVHQARATKATPLVRQLAIQATMKVFVLRRTALVFVLRLRSGEGQRTHKLLLQWSWSAELMWLHTSPVIGWCRSSVHIASTLSARGITSGSPSDRQPFAEHLHTFSI